MPGTRLRALEATALLKRDHDQVRRLLNEYKVLFSEYDEQGVETLKGRRAILEELTELLTGHGRLEEETFYPAISAIDRETAAVELILSARAEHRLVNTLLEELSDLDPGDEAFKEKMKVLSENVEHHLDEEEDKIFPLFGMLDREKQGEISQALAQKRMERSGGTEAGDW
jgi:hemerythrin superfamily protein